MSALARTTQSDCYTRAANEDSVNGGLRTRTKYSYDANGNQLSTTGTVAFTDSIGSSSNQLSATTGALARTYSYDAAGNTTNDGTRAYTFNQRGRLSQATVGSNSTSHIYNALGQLIEKSGSAGTTLLVYDEAGHLLGEYTGSGAVIQETVWMGDIPVATLQPNGNSVAIYCVHTDHLGTPRKITRPSDNGLMWRWDPDTFGSVAPNQNPSGFGTFTYNLRFAGQYYLSESGLHYNYFRDYDPATGRYLESDPIGLAAGVNTYAYVGGNPLSNIDPFGLDVTVTLYNAAHGFGHIGTAVNSSVTQGLYPVQDGVDVIAGLSVPGVIKTDSEPVIDSLTIHTTPAQDVAIQAAIDKARKNPPKYNLYRNNCAQESAQFLHAGGLNVPSDTLPKNYFDALKNLFKNQTTSH